MVVNRELFFRGWLPAGLLINARLITSAPASMDVAVLKPILNPVPGKGWPTHQPSPVFPIEQASSDEAIVLVDPFPDGALVMTLTPEWLGSGTPYLLAANTWYEGRIRSVSGLDVMGVRLVPTAYDEYYSYYSGSSVKDVRVYNMPCRHILGRSSEQVLVSDKSQVSAAELGLAPQVNVGDTNTAARVVDVLSLSSLSFAGMQSAYKEQNPGTETHIIQCAVVDGKIKGGTPKMLGLAAAPKASRQSFYKVSRGEISEKADVIKGSGTFATVASGRSTGGADQVVHYN